MEQETQQSTARNVLGTELRICGTDPVTGFYRDGCCNTGPNDLGLHTVCAVMTEEFLAFSSAHGNDLSTPREGFSGLRAGDCWCLCAARWLEAARAHAAPPVLLESTNEATLQVVPLELLRHHALDREIH